MASNISPSAFDKEQIFGMAEKEMEYRVELFNKMTQTCFNKCVDNRYKESELNMGENSCIDRCVSKYWHVTNLIGQLLGSGRPPIARGRKEVQTNPQVYGMPSPPPGAVASNTFFPSPPAPHSHSKPDNTDNV
ncbi:Mitochondrial import inner membrane translocase subunit TIM10 [Glycine max]|nr:Mitochondrial import inner membrane translocase subunit TIM10 [Glycine max]